MSFYKRFKPIPKSHISLTGNLINFYTDGETMEDVMNQLNWPTAFVIAATILVTAFIYNKPITANNRASSGAISAQADTSVWQLRDGQVRRCWIYTSLPVEVDCSPWTKD